MRPDLAKETALDIVAQYVHLHLYFYLECNAMKIHHTISRSSLYCFSSYIRQFCICKFSICQLTMGRTEANQKSSHLEDLLLLDQQSSSSTSTTAKSVASDTKSQDRSLPKSSTNGLKQNIKPAAQTMSSSQIEEFVRKEYLNRFHDASGKLQRNPDFPVFAQTLQKMRPGYSKLIENMVNS